MSDDQDIALRSVCLKNYSHLGQRMQHYQLQPRVNCEGNLFQT